MTATIPTFQELEAAGADAGAVIDAAEFELIRAIPMAGNPDARKALVHDLRAVGNLREKWFGGAA